MDNLFQNSSSDFKKGKTVNPKTQVEKIQSTSSKISQKPQTPINAQFPISEIPDNSIKLPFYPSQKPQASTSGISVPQTQDLKSPINDKISKSLKIPKTLKASKTSVDGIDNNDFSQTVQSPVDEEDADIELINGIIMDSEDDENENDNHTLNNQSIRPEPNPRHIKLYVDLKVPQILNNWFMYEKDSDYQKLIKINKKIEKSNESSDLLLKEEGKLPISEYTFHLQKVAIIMKKLQKNDKNLKAWQEWGNLMKSWDLVNMGRSLPVDWKISDDYLQIKCGISLPNLNQNNQQKESDDMDIEDLNSSSESESDSELDDTPAGIRQAVQQENLIPMIGKVLAFRNTGKFGQQCFVQYGSDKAPTYRLIPASQAGSWNQNSVSSWPPHQRGQIQDENGYKYCEANIQRLLGIAWKPKEEYQNSEEDAMDPQLWEGRAPITYILVLWKDNITTIETRTSIRRILGNLNNSADYMILKKAQSQEQNFQKAQHSSSKKLLQGPPKKKSIKAAQFNNFQNSRKNLSVLNSTQLPATLPAQQLKELMNTLQQLIGQ